MNHELRKAHIVMNAERRRYQTQRGALSWYNRHIPKAEGRYQALLKRSKKELFGELNRTRATLKRAMRRVEELLGRRPQSTQSKAARPATRSTYRGGLYIELKSAAEVRSAN